MLNFCDEFVQFRENKSDDTPDNLDPIELSQLNQKDYLDNPLKLSTKSYKLKKKNTRDNQQPNLKQNQLEKD